MKTPGDLISAADYAVSFRRLEPVPELPRRLLLLLHGWGSDESQLAALGAAVDDDTLVVLPRGPRSAAGVGLGSSRQCGQSIRSLTNNIPPAGLEP